MPPPLRLDDRPLRLTAFALLSPVPWRRSGARRLSWRHPRFLPMPESSCGAALPPRRFPKSTHEKPARWGVIQYLSLVPLISAWQPPDRTSSTHSRLLIIARKSHLRPPLSQRRANKKGGPGNPPLSEDHNGRLAVSVGSRQLSTTAESRASWLIERSRRVAKGRAPVRGWGKPR